MTTIQERMSLRGRRVLLTGSAGGLGRVAAEALAELGADLLLVDRPGIDQGQAAEQLAARWQVAAIPWACDLEDEADRTRLIQVLGDEGRPLHVLINNAAFVGTSELPGWNAPFEAQSVATWRRALEVNLTAPFHLTQGLAPLLRRAPGAAIVNVGSIYGLLGPDWGLYADTPMHNPAAYGASKGGLLQLTRWLATTLAPDIRVNAVSPGGIERGQPEAFQQRYRARTPLGRMADADDLVGALVYLATDLSAYVTGQNLSVDGGWGVW